jgi:hypothetical protein
MASEIDPGVRTLGHVEMTRILPQPPSMEYNAVRKDVASYLAIMVPKFMMFEANIEERDKQSQRCMVIIIPQSLSEDKDLIVDVETRVHDILSTNVLQLNILGGRVGLQTNSAFARNPHRYEVVECGASIGPAGKEWSGSFGGYLMDESTGDIYGLTCAHNLCRFDCNDNVGNRLRSLGSG